MRGGRLLTAVAGLALIAPTPLLTAARAEQFVATPICGDSAGNTAVLPRSVSPTPSASTTTYTPAGKPRIKKPIPKRRTPIRKPPPPSVDVATVNTLHGLDDVGDVTLEQRLVLQADQLAGAQVDIVGGQEFSRTINHGNVAAKLAFDLSVRTKTTWYWCWFAANPHFPGEPETRDGGGGPLSDLLAANTRANEAKFEEGPAILSRYPLLAAEAFRMVPEAPQTIPRCFDPTVSPPPPDPMCPLRGIAQSRAALWARARTPIGDIDVISAHTSGLPTQHSDLVRFASEKIAADNRAVLVCDCNSVEGSEAYNTIAHSDWHDTFRGLNRSALGWTSHQDPVSRTGTASERIDYVFVRDGGLRAVRSGVFLQFPGTSTTTESRVVWPSDHYAVVTSFER